MQTRTERLGLRREARARRVRKTTFAAAMYGGRRSAEACKATQACTVTQHQHATPSRKDLSSTWSRRARCLECHPTTAEEMCSWGVYSAHANADHGEQPPATADTDCHSITVPNIASLQLSQKEKCTRRRTTAPPRVFAHITSLNARSGCKTPLFASAMSGREGGHGRRLATRQFLRAGLRVRSARGHHPRSARCGLRRPRAVAVPRAAAAGRPAAGRRATYGAMSHSSDHRDTHETPYRNGASCVAASRRRHALRKLGVAERIRKRQGDLSRRRGVADGNVARARAARILGDLTLYPGAAFDRHLRRGHAGDRDHRRRAACSRTSTRR